MNSRDTQPDHSNGSGVPPSGVWPPAIILFKPETDNLVPEAQAKYLTYLSKSGLAGLLLVLGTNAETFLLTREERGKKWSSSMPHINDATKAGADYALVLPPAYFAELIEKFFAELANKSSLSLVLYNFPGVCNDGDLGSAPIAKLAKKHDDIAGITRPAAELPPERFAVFGGQSNFLTGGPCIRPVRCIVIFANVFQVYRLYKASCKSSIAATKYTAAICSAQAAGIENAVNLPKPRHLYIDPSERTVAQQMAEISGIEKTL
ncbi:aldolase [Biscogniauxia marginata]|nr:aldolase [Biscogniauxia marginata]